MTKTDTAASGNRRRFLALLGMVFVVSGSVILPAGTAWADNDKSDSDGGGDSGGDGGNSGSGGGGGDSGGDGGNSGSGGGGGDSGGGGDDSGSGGGSDGGGDSTKDDNDGQDGSDDRPSNGSNRAGSSSTRKAVEDGDGSLATQLKGKIASLQEIEALAAKMIPGEIVDVRLRRENGRVVYRLKIIQKNNRLVVLRIDAKTRKRLGSMSP